MKNRIWILFIILAACSIPAFGQSRLEPEEVGNQMCIDCDGGGGGGWSGSSSYSQGQYMDNPCTAIQDYVWVDYQAYASGLQPDEGVYRYKLSENTTMSGMYATSGAGSADVGYAAQFSTRQYHKVNTPDNFHVVTVMTFNPSTNSLVMSVERACGDGTPNSLE
jgi:hypothetical protein